MENPIKAFEGLPKNQKIIAIGGAITLGGILVYLHHKKQQSADAGASTDNTDSTTGTDGTASSGVQDNGTGAYDQYSNDEGIAPYQDASDPYGSYYGSGGEGFGSYSPGSNPGNVGAGDLANGTTISLPDSFGTDIGAGIAAGLGESDATGITGGGAPHTDPTKHMTARTPTRANGTHHATGRRKTTGIPHETTQHKTNAPGGTSSQKSRTTKARPKGKPKPRRRTVGARMSF